MRRDEKSDEAVVPEKQANKAAEAAAELVEGRASAKRNAEQRSAVRTQSRVTASQGLGSVRKAARKHRSARFTNLLHHVDVTLLGREFSLAEESGSSG